ncbi:hypothetical protein P152DRAFT_330721 [Eremomyces bilateralis CBS 781.70]|uniref:Uncharacterized protein n=1 Tax=Eremomyces bilateralis CBS 781.70 TaxID=1392243 RepID=A0A6G1G4C1_9PEZI|nr:uncharacterized protein P152DRAFT_330721 [Eremomyces bilateralis CBS 781.70]KAF1812914.1 hypothetical protein P152DRAFT_330721 [Eremomyces bilateralis CBS 781.70]
MEGGNRKMQHFFGAAPGCTMHDEGNPCMTDVCEWPIIHQSIPLNHHSINPPSSVHVSLVSAFCLQLLLRISLFPQEPRINNQGPLSEQTKNSLTKLPQTSYHHRLISSIRLLPLAGDTKHSSIGKVDIVDEATAEKRGNRKEEPEQEGPVSCVLQLLAIRESELKRRTKSTSLPSLLFIIPHLVSTTWCLPVRCGIVPRFGSSLVDTLHHHSHSSNATIAQFPFSHSCVSKEPRGFVPCLSLNYLLLSVIPFRQRYHSRNLPSRLLSTTYVVSCNKLSQQGINSRI